MFFLVPADKHYHSYGVYYRFVPYIVPYMKPIPIQSRKFEILTQLFETSRFGIGEHLVEGGGKLYPTPHKEGIYLHVATGAAPVDAHLNDNDEQKILLKDGELNLFYLTEKTNSAKLSKGFYCFFHARSSVRTFTGLVRKMQTPENAEKVLSLMAAAGRAIEAGSGLINSSSVELDPYGASLIQEIRDIRIIPRKTLKSYINKKIEQLMLHFLDRCINTRDTSYSITGDDIHMIDSVKDYIWHHLHNQPSAAQLGIKYNIPTEKLNNIFAQFYGVPLDTYIEHCRVEKAVCLLTDAKQSTSLIATVTGFRNYQALTAYFIAHFGCAPSDFR